MGAPASVHRAGIGSASGVSDADPITTEVIRHGLDSAANQMKRSLMRTAFSPVIYEVLDFAVAIYDREVRLLAQAPSLPLFMGTLNFCVEAAVEAVGGADTLAPGDVLMYNYPFGTGSHAQDAALVMPVFRGTDLVGYSAVKGHWVDIGGKDPYSTDTVDLFQEGTVFPGVRLYSGGSLVDDVYRIALANSRVPHMVAGDIHAEVVCVRTGAEALLRVIDRYGREVFERSVERMFDHGEAIVRGYFEKLPNGRYVAMGEMDDDGISAASIPFEVAIEIDGSNVCIDYSHAPDEREGPVNCPLPSTVSASRVAISMLAGGGESPNEGHFRPIEVVTRPGSMFHPLAPAPTFLYGWPALQAIEVIYRALSQVMPTAVPACSGGDIIGVVWWGEREKTGEQWVGGSAHPVGQGAHARGDGANSLIHVSEAATRFPPTEVREAKYPYFLEKVELTPDSCGAGKYRGGLGLEFHFRMLEDCWVTPALERTKNAPWGLAGGRDGRPNLAALRLPDGTRTTFGKATRLKLPKGSTLEIYGGGGGGFGDPGERDPIAVLNDLAEGYITPEHARLHYPHAFQGGGST